MARKKVNKLKETEKRTVVGKVIRIFDRSETNKDDPARSEQVQNIELVVVGEEGEEYWQVTCYGAEALARIAGYTLSPDGSAWQQTLEPIKVGDRLAVTGNFRLKPWQSRNFGVVQKPTLTIYSSHQLKPMHLPKVPWAVPVKPAKAPKPI